MRISDGSSDVCSSDLPTGHGSDATTFRRPHAIVRNGRDIADRSDREADRLQGSERAFTARSGALHLYLERAHTVFGGLLASIVGGKIGRASCRERVCQYV